MDPHHLRDLVRIIREAVEDELGPRQDHCRYCGGVNQWTGYPADHIVLAIERELERRQIEIHWATPAEKAEQARRREELDARFDGQHDGEAGHRDRAERWPPGSRGHGDYELGQQDAELRRQRQQKAIVRKKLGLKTHQGPSKTQRRAGLALGHPKP